MTAEYASGEEAARAIPAAVTEFYKSEHPRYYDRSPSDVEEAGRVLSALHNRNVFPDLGVTWGTYPDNGGHDTATDGCFRCHGGEHVSEAGQKLTNHCFACHRASAMSETKPEILKALGLDRPIDAMRKR